LILSRDGFFIIPSASSTIATVACPGSLSLP
jgi:hypothetical protein